nr:carboxypeptidase regulatory-like domain-containing protein [Oscillospiraceae bacterium]
MKKTNTKKMLARLVTFFIIAAIVLPMEALAKDYDRTISADKLKVGNIIQPGDKLIGDCNAFPAGWAYINVDAGEIHKGTTVAASFEDVVQAMGGIEKWNIPAGKEFSGWEITVVGGCMCSDVDPVANPRHWGNPVNLVPVFTDAPPPTVPTLTAGAVNRTSDATATVKFTSSVAGQYYYIVKEGTGLVFFPTTGAGTPCTTAETTISVTDMTAGEKYIYIIVKDAAGNASDKLRIAIPAYTPSSSGDGIRGTVTDDASPGAPIVGAVVALKKGGTNGTQIGSSITTDAQGNFSFSDIPYGSYSLVVTHGGRTVTKSVVFNSAAAAHSNIIMPTANKDMAVEVKPNTPSVAAGNLEQQFTPADAQLLASNPAATIEIKLVVEQKPEAAVPSDALLIRGAIASTDQVGFYLDVKLIRTVQGAASPSDNTVTTIQPQAAVNIVLDLPEELWGLDPYSVIRVHGSTTKTIAPLYDPILHTLTFSADAFSTYAIIVTPKSNGTSEPDYAHEFWSAVGTKALNAKKGDVLKVDAGNYDKMPAPVMENLRLRGAGIVITWNGGKTITIPAGKALNAETGRIHWPLSLLAQKYSGTSIKQNPQTGVYS